MVNHRQQQARFKALYAALPKPSTTHGLVITRTARPRAPA
jgi:hypothetical protein